MNDVVFNGSYAPLTDEEIAEFEAKHQLKLPPKYRAFLLRTNGGHPHKQLIPDVCHIQCFLAIADESQSISLARRMRPVELPGGLIAIGFGGGGDYICVSLFDDRIYLWDREADYADSHEAPSLSEMKVIAHDIDDLLGRLEGDKAPRPDDEVAQIGRWGRLDYLEIFLAAGRNIDEVSPSGRCIVNAAAYTENLGFLKECVRRGAVLKDRGLLHAAMFKMDAPMTAYLLEQGVNPNEIDERGETPMDNAPHWATGLAIQILEAAGGVRSNELQKSLKQNHPND